MSRKKPPPSPVGDVNQLTLFGGVAEPPTPVAAHPGEQLAMFDRTARQVLDGPVVAGSFHRVPEQLLDHGGRGFAQRELQAAYVAARGQDAYLTPEGFLAGLDVMSPVGEAVRALLGEVSWTLLRTAEPAEFESALLAAYRDFRTAPPPYDGGISYGSYRYAEGRHLDLSTSRLTFLPMNAPVFDREVRALVYPSWEVGRARATRSMMAVQAARVTGREVPLHLEGRDLFEALRVRHSAETFESYLDPELRQSLLQTAFCLSTGYSPIYRSAIQRTGRRIPGLHARRQRNALQARWELAARLERPGLLDETTALGTVWERLPAAVRNEKPRTIIPHDAFTQLTVDELFQLVLDPKRAPRVVLNTFEWEHHRSQRFTYQVFGLAARLGLDAQRRSRFAALTGLCEPENLSFVAPWQHARLDFYAGGYAELPELAGRGAELWTGAFRPNPARMDQWGNMPYGVRPSEQGGWQFVASRIEDDIAFESIMGSRRNSWAGVVDFSWHPDLARARNTVVAYQPHEVAALLGELLDPVTLRSASKFSQPEDLAAWNAIAGPLNQAADLYGFEKTLRLPELS